MGPEELVAYGANACIKRDDSLAIYEKHVREGRDIYKFKEKVLNVSIGSGHLSVLDQASFTFVFKNVPRITTMFIVSPIFLSHLQQSMRSVDPYGYYIPNSIRNILEMSVVNEVIRSFKLYYKFVSWGVPREDARFILPLYTVTNIQTIGNARELTHLYLMSKDKGVPSVTRKVIGDMWKILLQRFPILFKYFNIEVMRIRYYPAPQLFNDKNQIKISDPNNVVKLIGMFNPLNLHDEIFIEALKNLDETLFNILKTIKFTLTVKISLATLHQILRQRTWWHIPESIYNAVNTLEYIIPYSIKRRSFHRDFSYQVERQYDLYNMLIDKGVPKEEAIGVISHAHIIRDIITIDGWNMLSTIPLRRCLKAQWEIRRISNEIANYIGLQFPILGRLSSPSCLVFGYCPEKYPCPQRDIFLSRKPYLD